MAASRLSRWAILIAAALAMILRQPVYLIAPSFWAEEGALYFVRAWDASLGEALAYRPAGYLLLWANLATTTSARAVQAGWLSLTAAPRVTVLFALLAQLSPVAVIAWGRAPFWGGTIRRVVAVAIVLLGVFTDEIWLNTVNSQPWLVLAAALLLLEPPADGWRRTWGMAGLLLLAGLSAPVVSALAPLFLWRAWRARYSPSQRSAVALAVVAAGCGLVQLWCVMSTALAGQLVAPRTSGIAPGVFAATVWMRTLVVPLLGSEAARAVGALVGRGAGIGPFTALLLLALAGALLAWLGRGVRPEARLPLLGAYALVTILTLLTTVGDKAILLHSPRASSRYVFVPGVLVLLMLLGGIRSGVGGMRVVLCGLLLALRLGQGAWDYPTSVRWTPAWPRWSQQVWAWQIDPRWPLAIWPPPWKLHLTPLPASSASSGAKP